MPSARTRSDPYNPADSSSSRASPSPFLRTTDDVPARNVVASDAAAALVTTLRARSTSSVRRNGLARELLLSAGL